MCFVLYTAESFQLVSSETRILLTFSTGPSARPAGAEPPTRSSGNRDNADFSISPNLKRGEKKVCRNVDATKAHTIPPFKRVFNFFPRPLQGAPQFQSLSDQRFLIQLTNTECSWDFISATPICNDLNLVLQNDATECSCSFLHRSDFHYRFRFGAPKWCNWTDLSWLIFGFELCSLLNAEKNWKKNCRKDWASDSWRKTSFQSLYRTTFAVKVDSQEDSFYLSPDVTYVWHNHC